MWYIYRKNGWQAQIWELPLIGLVRGGAPGAFWEKKKKEGG
jgi:hypothetical protein